MAFGLSVRLDVTDCVPDSDAVALLEVAVTDGELLTESEGVVERDPEADIVGVEVLDKVRVADAVTDGSIVGDLLSVTAAVVELVGVQDIVDVRLAV